LWVWFYFPSVAIGARDWLYRHISAYNPLMRRKPGALLPIEDAILRAAIRLWRTGSAEFHGYEIAKHVAEESKRRTALTAYGTLYRALFRLENMGLLASRQEDPQIAARENRPGRRLYLLTGAGVAAAQAASQPAPSTRVAKPRKRGIPAARTTRTRH
jgi:PadR family transcriptional regulator